MVIVLCSIARCIIFGVPRLPVRPCDERPPAIYGHFCLVPRVSVHDRYYSRTPLIRPPSESHWCGRMRGMVAREGFIYFALLQ